jgi:capsular polysaccharide biosynthesis protein
LIEDLSQISTEINEFKFGPGRVNHIRVAGPLPFLPPKPLLVTESEFAWDWLQRWHTAGAMPDPCMVNCYFIKDMTLLGHDTVALDRDIATGNEAIPQYRASQIRTSHADEVARQLELPCRIIEDICFPLAVDGNVYGHFLIETLPRLHLMMRHFHRYLPEFRILLKEGSPAWLWKILTDVYHIDPNRIITHNPQLEHVLLRKAIWPSLTVFSDYLHPINNSIINELVGEFGAGGRIGIKRLFITRSLFSNPVMQARPFLNESELVGISVKEFGCFPVAPETMSWSSQIKLFSEAELVVGQFGSGVHNTIFCKPGARVGVIRFGNLLQSNISALRDHEMAYIVENNDDNPFQVDPEIFRQFMRSLVN